ncbi:hypothetical protein NL676_029955 [Syzygium grande]|nr:hypothetical protein NL676_029955 [Syzygium grande]
MAEHLARASFPWIVHDRVSRPCIIRSWPSIVLMHPSFMAEGHACASFVHGRGSRPCIGPMDRSWPSIALVHRTVASWQSAWDVADGHGQVHRSWPSASVLAEPRGRVHRSYTRLMAKCVGLA